MQTQTTMTTDELKTALAELHGLLAEGKFLEAMEKFLDDDVTLQEANDEPKRGKAFCIEAERKLLEDVASFGGYHVSKVGYGEDTTFYEAVMDFTLKDGTEVHMEQCVVDTWRDGKIVSERFYHA